jgi:hypothetical protein
MTQQKESVVTPERFGSGMTWEQWMAHIQRNVKKFQYNYDETSVSDKDAKRLKALSKKPNGPAQVLIIGEDWCPDVVRGLPVIQRIADAAGLEARHFPRDENSDIMSEFLNHGEHQSIPVAVFYTADHEYIAHWIERPAKAQAELGEIQKLFVGLDREKDAKEMRRLYDDFQLGPMWASWREATIEEITALLEEKCG